MQSIQDQQNTLIGAVLPLVPIIHGVSPQMDQIKATLSDLVANAVSTMTNSVENVRSSLVAEFAHGHGRMESSIRVGSSSKSTSSRRRRSVPQEANIPVSSPLDSRGLGGPRLSLKRARIEGATHCAVDAQLPRKLSRLTVPLTNSGDPPPLLQTPQTPRRPLADLLLIPGSNNSTVRATSRGSRGCMRPHEVLRASGGSSTNIPRTSRSPLQPLGYAQPDLLDSMITRRPSAELHDMPLAIGGFAMELPSAAGPSDQDALSKAIKIEEILEPKLTGVFSVHSSPLSSPPSSMPSGARRDPRETSDMHSSRQQDNISDPDQVELVHIAPPSFGPLSSNPDGSPPKSMSLRARRAQMSRVSR